jgi:SLOG cluster3 family
MPVAPVFLSASVPDPARDGRYFSTGDSIAIRDAVLALLKIVLPKTTLIFGGHPAITPMVKFVADQAGLFHKVCMFQSEYFRALYLADLELFHYQEVPADPRGKEASLEAMRKAMITGTERFSAAFFIGGMEGVEQEYRLVLELKPGTPCFPVYTTGGAARGVWDLEARRKPTEEDSLRTSELEDLRKKVNYTGLFTRLLDRVWQN